jgi:hypothetical protein
LLKLECVLDPLDAVFTFCGAEQQRIKPAWRGTRQVRQVVLRRMDEFGLLARINASGGSSEEFTASHTHLGEYQSFTVL